MLYPPPQFLADAGALVRRRLLAYLAPHHVLQLGHELHNVHHLHQGHLVYVGSASFQKGLVLQAISDEQVDIQRIEHPPAHLQADVREEHVLQVLDGHQIVRIPVRRLVDAVDRFILDRFLDDLVRFVRGTAHSHFRQHNHIAVPSAAVGAHGSRLLLGGHYGCLLLL